MTSQPGEQTISMHVLPNVSRSKGNQTMKFGHLNVARETFLLKNQTKNVVETSIITLFWKIKTKHISGSIVYSFIHSNCIPC